MQDQNEEQDIKISPKQNEQMTFETQIEPLDSIVQPSNNQDECSQQTFDDIEQNNKQCQQEEKLNESNGSQEPIKHAEPINNNLQNFQENENVVQEQHIENINNIIITSNIPEEEESFNQHPPVPQIDLETLKQNINEPSSCEESPHRSQEQINSNHQVEQQNVEMDDINEFQRQIKEKDKQISDLNQFVKELQDQNTKYFQQIKNALDSQIKLEKSKNQYKEQIKDLKRIQEPLQSQFVHLQNENKKLKAEKDQMIKQTKDELDNLFVIIEQKKKEIHEKNAYIMLVEERMSQQQQIIDLHNEETRQFFELNQELKQKEQEIEFLKKKLDLLRPQFRASQFYQPINNPEQYRKNDTTKTRMNQKINPELPFLSKTVSSISPIKQYQQAQKTEQYPTFRTPLKPQFPTYVHTEPNLIFINDERQDSQILEEIYQASLDKSYSMIQKNQHLFNIDPLQNRETPSIIPSSGMRTFTRNSQESVESKDHKYVNEEQKNTINNYKGDQLGLMRHGSGRQLYLNDNSIYEGEWKFDKRHGTGVLYQQNGNIIYEGQWENDMMHGFGKLKNMFKTHNKNNMLDDWAFYEGNFKKNQFQGKGTMILRNGDKYDGDFENNLADGEGIILKKNGEEIKAQWARGSLVQLPKPNIQEI